MIQFRLFGYPVRIEWMFWILIALLGMNALKQPGRDGVIMLLMWVALAMFSILWHEFGHALARKKFGQPYSEIVLHGFGGYCKGPGRFTRGQSMWISFAGPLASFLLGGIIYLLVFTPAFSSNPWLQYFVKLGLWVNIGWALLNLLPIYPLDGGQIFAAWIGNRKPQLVPKVGMIVAAAVAIYGFVVMGSLWMAFLFGLLAYQNWQRSQGMQPRGPFS